MSIRDLLTKIENGPDDPDAMDDAEMADWWADTAMRLAAAARVALDVVEVRYHYQDPTDTDGYVTRSEGELILPAWCSGDPKAGVALHLFGYADAVKAYDIQAEVIG